MIKIDKLTILFDDIKAVDSISLELRPGKIYGIIGPNGAGKSTLLKACAGLISPYDGSIIFEQKDIRKNRKWQKQNCAYAPDEVELLPYLKGHEFLQLIGSIRKVKNPEKEIDTYVSMLGLSMKKEELITDFSHGMRQKLAIAAALMGSPKYLIFDETLNGLDTISLNQLKQHIQKLAQKGSTILLSTHVLSIAREWCTEIIVLKDGRLKGILIEADIKNWVPSTFPQFK